MSDPFTDALAAHQEGRVDEAKAFYGAALEQDPKNAAANYNLGMLCGQTDNPRDAVAHITEALKLKPDFGDGWLALSGYASAIGAQDLYRFACEQATRLMPSNAEASARYGTALSQVGDNVGALNAFRRAVDIEPTRIASWVNLCVIAKRLGDYDEAERAIRQACALSDINLTPNIPEEHLTVLHWHLALIELQRGDYANGFSHFRARFYGGTDWKRIQSDKPLWQGEDIAGKTLFVISEQGHGDTLMLARYLPLLKQRGARIHLATQPALVSYMKQWDILDDVFPLGQSPKVPFDYHTAMFDLPFCCKTTLETLPQQAPYLPKPLLDPALQLPPTPTTKVGVLWRGQPANVLTDIRKIPLSDFATLFEQPGFTFYNLTRELEGDEEAILTAAQVQNLAPLMNNFAAVATLVDQLDVIVTCDTALAHMAGGLGKPTLTLLAATADWRWSTDGAESAWYPTMRLFRRMMHKGWDTVVVSVAEQLRSFAPHATNNETMRHSS